ncbi:hypothetical protein Clacol_010018 [Clathrus columnatus]|uniref:Ribosome assembly protein 1 n=1 Tax=Clathrus columnatus TaxID=1419009 RepID=A0AAV5ASN6_9AGAM|nr:hypothetical protein Clacol_010018 [Clathrus columnatus]
MASMAEPPKAEDVRVVQTIGHVDHGKTTFVDSLLAANNIISTRMAGKIRYMDSREDEQQRGITMESSAVSLQFKVMERNTEGGITHYFNNYSFPQDSIKITEPRPRNYIVSLVDTPGHVDFSSEVSIASRLCDGALVIVDVVEGVCTQTIAVLRQAWEDRLKPILVINKFDRLITELKLSPTEAYHHLSQLIEQVNAVMGSFFAGERMEDDLRWREERERRLAERSDKKAEEIASEAMSDSIVEDFQEKDDEDIYFAPERGNVIFASAIDGWGFRIGKFAQLFAKKLGMKEANLRKALWGDFYLDPKTKRVITHRHLKGRSLKSLFVQFILENIWAAYDGIILNPNPEKVNKIIAALDLKVPPRDLKTKDPKHLLSVIFSQWLSLSTCTIQAVIDVVPPPSVAQRTRIPKMIYPDLHEDTVQPKNRIESYLWQCDASEEAFVVAYVSKMFAVPTKELPSHKPKALTAEEMRRRGRELREAKNSQQDGTQPEEAVEVPLKIEEHEPVVVEGANSEQPEETLLGFARLYSGTIHVNSHIYCILPKYNNSLPPTHPKNSQFILTTQVRNLYIMMGRELRPADKVTAGNIFAIAGLEGKVWRSATICAPGGPQGAVALNDESSEHILNLGAVNRQSLPIVRVALETVHTGTSNFCSKSSPFEHYSTADMPKLVKGLRLLAQSDPCVETFQQQTGEYVILTAGELHFEVEEFSYATMYQSDDDLRERFSKVELQASNPIVPFRETAIRATDLPPPKAGANQPRGTVSGTAGGQGVVKFTLRALPLPAEIISFLQANISIIKKLGEISGSQSLKKQQELAGETLNFETTLREAEAGEDDDSYELENAMSGEIAQRPTVKAENFWTTLGELFDKSGQDWKNTVGKIWSFGPHRYGPNILLDRRGGVINSLRDHTRRPSDGKNIRDFDDSIETGFQIATFQGPLCAEPVVGMAFVLQDLVVGDSEDDTSTSRAGSLIAAAKEACRNGMLDWSPRLMLAMYSCDIQASTEVLGKVYGTVAKRRGRIIAEEIKEGTSYFTVKAMLPVVESFGFAHDIRTRTSGAASPQLIFSGYEMYDQDPFWVPTTEEELEDLGEKADRENVARVYMDSVRERKGMAVERKIVQFAEKQRTLKR